MFSLLWFEELVQHIFEITISVSVIGISSLVEITSSVCTAGITQFFSMTGTFISFSMVGITSSVSVV